MGDVIVEVREPGRTPLRVVVTGPLVLGRDCEGLLLADQQMSRRHAELRPAPGGVSVTDLGSTNGCFMDGERFTGTQLLSGDRVLRVGATTVTLHHTAGSPFKATMISALDEMRRTAIDDVSDAVAGELPALAHQEHAHGTITIVFSDIEGSTERVSALGDKEWFEILAIHNEVVRRQVRRHGGTEAKNQGDGFMLTFPSARRAVEAMTAVQRELSDETTRARTADLRVRVGMHTGEVIVDDGGELFGRHVHMASRIASQAVGGEIVVSSLTRALLETRGDLHFGEPREAMLKGIAEPQLVHPLLWSEA